MSSWTPIVQCNRRSGEEPRFIITYLAPTRSDSGIDRRGPDGGKDSAGYTESELRAELAKRGLSDGEIESLIQRAVESPV
jgi:hypothetical protein